MSTIVTIPKEQFDNLNSRLRYVESMVQKMAEKVGLQEKKTDQWRKEVDDGLEDIKNGRCITLKTPEELQQFLDSLK